MKIYAKLSAFFFAVSVFAILISIAYGINGTTTTHAYAEPEEPLSKIQSVNAIEYGNRIEMNHVDVNNAYEALTTDEQREAYHNFEKFLEDEVDDTQQTQFYRGNISKEELQLLVSVIKDDFFDMYGTGQFFCSEYEDGTRAILSIPSNNLRDYQINKEYKKKIEDVAKNITNPYMTEMEAFNAISDYIKNHLEYTSDCNYSQGGIAFDNGLATCEGYSHLLKEMLTAIGIEAKTVVGYGDKNYTLKNIRDQKIISDSEMQTHMWNRVKLNGIWYWCDITWQDSLGDDAYGPTTTLWKSHVTDMKLNN